MTAPLFSRSPHPLGSSAEAPTPGESVARHPGDGGPTNAAESQPCADNATGGATAPPTIST